MNDQNFRINIRLIEMITSVFKIYQNMELPKIDGQYLSIIYRCSYYFLSFFFNIQIFTMNIEFSQYYALINRARSTYEEIFVMTFKTYGPKSVRSMRLKCQNDIFDYFSYGPKSRLIRVLLYTYTQIK